MLCKIKILVLILSFLLTSALPSALQAQSETFSPDVMVGEWELLVDTPKESEMRVSVNSFNVSVAKSPY